jgi:hypothetical protein
VIVSLVVVVCESVPAAPLMVIVKVPSCARPVALSRSVVAVPGVAGFLVQVGVTPDGRPLTLIVVGLLKPFNGFTVTDRFVLRVRRTVAVAGALTVKSACAAATVAVEAEVALLGPMLLVAVTITSIVWPTSLGWTTYVEESEPTLEQEMGLVVQLCHW